MVVGIRTGKRYSFRTNFLKKKKKKKKKLFDLGEIWHSDLFEYAKFDGDVHFLF